MAVTKTILKASENETVVKVQGTSGTATINIATDILASTQVLDGSTQTVDIIGLGWSGAAGGVVQVKRNSVVITTRVVDNSGYAEFRGQDIPAETTENTSNIDVVISGAQAECWLVLRKVGGYKSKIEYAVFGQYDDPTVAGA